jgi:TolB protein
MKRSIWLLLALCPALLILVLQDGAAQDIKGTIQGGKGVSIALPDFRGTGAAQNLMSAFNETLWGDIANSGVVKTVPKTMYPITVPQQPSDFREPPPSAPDTSRGRNRSQIVTPSTGGGLWLTDWSGPPVSANYLAFGYVAVQNDVLVLSGWLFDLSRGTPANAQVIGKRYLSSVDEAGARKVAHEFAADILALLGGKSLYGTKIVFVSDRTAARKSGIKEVWTMDPDGSNQHQMTHFNALSIEPTISPDGTKIAFASYARGNPAIFIFSVDPVRQLPFYNQVASVNETPEFTPDGKQILYSSSASGWAQIYIANLDGSGLRRISSSAAIEVEPKVNPKTGTDIAFVSGRSGPQQIYRMNIDGGDVERLTNGEGEASNPSWSPDGQKLAFSWTRGYATGNFNIFVMDVASRNYIQLTHSEGRNENPSWAPDGVHIAFMSNRGGTFQIYSMLADGSQVRQLTTQGNNQSPVWGK